MSSVDKVEAVRLCFVCPTALDLRGWDESRHEIGSFGLDCWESLCEIVVNSILGAVRVDRLWIIFLDGSVVLDKGYPE